MYVFAKSYILAKMQSSLINVYKYPLLFPGSKPDSLSRPEAGSWSQCKFLSKTN